MKKLEIGAYVFQVKSGEMYITFRDKTVGSSISDDICTDDWLWRGQESYGDIIAFKIIGPAEGWSYE